jgi:hypothetical protein
MIRVVVFCKNALENQSTKAMIAMQAVGKSLQADEKGKVISRLSYNSTAPLLML